MIEFGKCVAKWQIGQPYLRGQDFGKFSIEYRAYNIIFLKSESTAVTKIDSDVL